MKYNQMEPQFGHEEAMAAYDYIMSGGWLTDFKQTRVFENMIADYVGVEFCSVVPSGDMALEIALRALGVGHGDKVLVPDYTHPSTAYVVDRVGATVILADVDPYTYNMLHNYSSGACKCAAVMCVHINGRLSVLPTFVAAEGIPVVEDACQALGSRRRSIHLGTRCHIGVLSFNTFKIISTGQGGALITNDEYLFGEIKKIRDFGRTSGRGSEYERLGLNGKFTDLQAVVGIEQMKRLDTRVEAKKRIYGWYEEILDGVEQVRFIPTNLKDCAPWYIDPLVEKRDELIGHLAQQGIETQPFYQPIHRLAHYREQTIREGLTDRAVDDQYPGASHIADNGIWLPSSCFLRKDDVHAICSEIKRFYNK